MLLGYEGANQAWAWFNFWTSTVSQGVWPLWDPFTFSGHAFAGEMQTGAFYPLYLAFLAVPFHHGVFSPQVYHYFYVLSHALAAWLMYQLAREFGLSFFAGLIAGTCFSLGGVLVRFGAWPHLLESGLWLPLILLLLLRALRTPDTKHSVAWSAAAGLALAMAVLAGGLHVVIMDGIVVVSAAVFHAVTAGRPVWKRAAIAVSVCAAFALAGGAIQLLPSAEYSHLSIRFIGDVAPLPATAKIPYGDMKDGIWPQGLLSLLVPIFSGGYGPGEFVNPYMGVFPLLLAIGGVWKRWNEMWVRYLAGLAAAAALYALGPFSLLNGFLYAVTPFLWMAREANRFLYLTCFALALLAGFGFDALFHNARRPEWDALTRIFKWTAIAAAASLGWAFVLGKGDLGVWTAFSLVLILLTFGLYRYIVAGHCGRWARLLALALILFDLNAFDWSATDQNAEAAAGHDEMARLLSLRGVAQFLHGQPGPFRVEWGIAHAPNIGDVYGIEDIGGAAVTFETDYDRFRGHADLLNVRYVIRTADAAEPNPVYADAHWKVYPNPSADPRAWLVHATEVRPDTAMLFARLDAPGFDPRRMALIAAPLGQSLEAPPAGPEQVSWHRPRADRLELKVRAGSRALLVLSELDYPGWHAEINGHAAPIVKVDGALRGVTVPAGVSRVTLDYAPRSFRAGLALSLAAFLAGGLLAVRLRRELRVSAPAGGSPR